MPPLKDFRVQPDISLSVLVSARNKKEEVKIATEQMARVIAAGAKVLGIQGKTTFGA